MSKINMIPPDSRIFQLINGFHISQALYVVTKIGVADHLINGPKNSTVLANELNVQSEALYRVLRSLSSLDVFYEDSTNKFALTPISQYLRSDNKDSLRNVILMNCGEERYQAFGKLLDNVKTGITAFNQVFGMGYFDYLSNHVDAYDIFNKAMGELTELRNSQQNPFDNYDFSNNNLIVDVAGGKGFLIASLLKKYPNAHGILFDLPEVVASAKSIMTFFETADRCEIRSGSILDSVPSGGDVYILSRVLHDWSDEDAIKILLNCRKEMEKESILLILDSILQEGILPSSVTQLDLNMMAVTGGKERTEKQWKQLLEKGGFKFDLSWKTDTNLIKALPL